MTRIVMKRKDASKQPFDLKLVTMGSTWMILVYGFKQ